MVRSESPECSQVVVTGSLEYGLGLCEAAAEQNASFSFAYSKETGWEWVEIG